MFAGGLTNRQIRDFRGAKRPIDPFVALGTSVEQERTALGIEDALTVFLAGAECPYTCVFCDLWQHTLDGATPEGAIPHQLQTVLEELDWRSPGGTIKLYNASNFFDPRAVPKSDHEAIAQTVDSFARVIVENHAKLTNESCKRFADRLHGDLEIAIGLETVEPHALALLNKGASLEDFDRACESLARNDIGLRTFVLLNAPYVHAAESVEWTRRSVEYSLAAGARHVTIIPTRGGNGALEHLAALHTWTPPTIGLMEQALVACLSLPGIVTVDLWDCERFADCACGTARTERLAQMNLTGTIEPPVACDSCEGSLA